MKVHIFLDKMALDRGVVGKMADSLIESSTGLNSSCSHLSEVKLSLRHFTWFLYQFDFPIVQKTI